MSSEDCPPVGCALCLSAPAAPAWDAIKAPATHCFVKELHYGVHATRCTCGQPFVVVFTERVDYREGCDSQVELAVAVRPEELAALAELGGAVGPALTRFAEDRRFLVKTDGDAPRWLARGFAIGPHD